MRESAKSKNESVQWSPYNKTIRAIQVAFEFGGELPDYIREVAAKNGLTPSDQIRKIIGLGYKKPKRPRLTISLREEDYINLGTRYNLSSEDRQAIREHIREELEVFYRNEKK